jgi:PIN domain nuclease of toxin-antitoxin system
VRILLDTHVFLWLQTDPARLGAQLGVLADRRNELIVSAVSSWEIAIKYRLGRFVLPEPPERYVPERLRIIGAKGLAIEHSHALAVAALAPLHRDPFDRLLVAQAALLDLRVMTADPMIVQYPVATIPIA